MPNIGSIYTTSGKGGTTYADVYVGSFKRGTLSYRAYLLLWKTVKHQDKMVYACNWTDPDCLLDMMPDAQNTAALAVTQRVAQDLPVVLSCRRKAIPESKATGEAIYVPGSLWAARLSFHNLRENLVDKSYSTEVPEDVPGQSLIEIRNWKLRARQHFEQNLVWMER